jgi:hypothetical protein
MNQHSADELRAIADVLERLETANADESHDLFFTGKIEVFWVDQKIGEMSVAEDHWDYIPSTQDDKENE